ncbi:MAG TPA: nucleotidyltransferase family protein [Allosphingosinicella sp.]|jgi:hypothetical protein
MKKLREHVVDPEPLPLFAQVAALPRFQTRRRASRFIELVQLNPYVRHIVDRLPRLSVEAAITSGCLVQTIWNLRQGRAPHRGIDDYDLIYFDPDTTWEKEDEVIREAEGLFADLEVKVQIRNQARVPLWYREKFGFDYPAVAEAHHSLLRYPSRSTAVALTRNAAGDWLFYAPFGLADPHDLRVRPNPKLPLAHVYCSKAARWQEEWPQIEVEPWDVPDCSGADCEGQPVRA